MLRKKPCCNNYEHIRNMQTVQRLIDEELLNIREQNGVITLFISFRLHSAMIDDERKLSRWYMRLMMRISLYASYRRYKNMLLHILIYINCMRWSRGEKAYEGSLNLLISNTKEDDILLMGYYSPSSDSIHFESRKPKG